MKRENQDQNGDSPNKRQRRVNEEEIRLLIPSKIAGAIIGKGGQNIQKLRSEYKATVAVTDCQGPERTVTVGSDMESICKIVKEMLKHFDLRDDEVDLRMMIHQSLAGCVIGKGGSKIKELRDKIGARLKIFSNVAPQSTDRVVQILGKPDLAIESIKEVCELVKQTPIKGPVHNYDPINFDDVYADEYGGWGMGGGNSTGSAGGRQNGGSGGGGSGGFRNDGGRFSGNDGRDNDRFDRRDGGRFSGGGDRGGRMNDRRSGDGGNDRGGRDGGRFHDFNDIWATNPLPNNQNNSMNGPLPPPNLNFSGMGNNMGNSGNMGGMSGPMGGVNMGGMGGPPMVNSGNMGGSGSGVGNMSGGGGGVDMSGKNSTQVTIPKDLAGAIIGKGGGRIRRIRNESNAHITIDEPLPGSTDRIITIAGTPKQIQTAQYLLQQSVHENNRRKF